MHPVNLPHLAELCCGTEEGGGLSPGLLAAPWLSPIDPSQRESRLSCRGKPGQDWDEKFMS